MVLYFSSNKNIHEYLYIGNRVCSTSMCVIQVNKVGLRFIAYYTLTTYNSNFMPSFHFDFFFWGGGGVVKDYIHKLNSNNRSLRTDPLIIKTQVIIINFVHLTLLKDFWNSVFCFSPYHWKANAAYFIKLPDLCKMLLRYKSYSNRKKGGSNGKFAEVDFLFFLRKQYLAIQR